MQPITVIALIDSSMASRRALQGARAGDPVRADAPRTRERRSPARRPRGFFRRAALRRA